MALILAVSQSHGHVDPGSMIDMRTLDALAERVLAGGRVTRDEARAVLATSDDGLLDVVAAAARVRRRYFGNRVKLNYLVNLKSGRCASARNRQDVLRLFQLPEGGSDRGSPKDGSTLFSKRVMAQIRSPARVRTNRPVPWRMPVGARR